MDFISRLGYSRFSPYQNSPFLDIKSPNGLIDMSNTDVPLLGIGLQTGTMKLLRPRSGTYPFPGDKDIREIKLNLPQFQNQEDRRFKFNPYMFAENPQPGINIHGLGAETYLNILNNKKNKLGLTGSIETTSVGYPGGVQLFGKPQFSGGFRFTHTFRNGGDISIPNLEKGNWLNRYINKKLESYQSGGQDQLSNSEEKGMQDDRTYFAKGADQNISRNYPVNESLETGTKDSKDFLKNWYTERAKNPNFTDVANKRLKELDKVKVTEISNPESDPLLKSGVAGYYDTTSKQVRINPNNPYSRGTLTQIHEIGHHLYDEVPQSDQEKIIRENTTYEDRFNQLMEEDGYKSKYEYDYTKTPEQNEKAKEQFERFGYNYHSIPTEIASRLLEFRKRYNIDPNHKYTRDEMINIIDAHRNRRSMYSPQVPYKYTSDEDAQSGDNSIDELLRIIEYNPRYLADLNSEIVYQQPSQQKLTTAKHGGWLNRYEDGGSTTSETTIPIEYFSVPNIAKVLSFNPTQARINILQKQGAFDTMDSFYDDLFNYANERVGEDGKVNPIRAGIGTALAYLKNPNIWFRKMHTLPVEISNREDNPYGVTPFSTQSRTFYPSKFILPKEEKGSREKSDKYWERKARREERKINRDIKRQFDCPEGDCYQRGGPLPKFQGLEKSQVTKNPKVNYIFTEHSDGAFPEEAKDLQTYLAKYYPEEQVKIISGYGDDFFNKQVTPILNNQIDNNDRFFLFGHHGSRYAGIPNQKWATLLENAQKRAGQFNCYLGSCFSEDLFLNPANRKRTDGSDYTTIFDKVGNFYYRPTTPWLGVNPNAAKGANSDQGILNAMFSTTTGSPNTDLGKIWESISNIRSKIRDEFREKNKKLFDEISNFTPEGKTQQQIDAFIRKRNEIFKREENILNSNKEYNRLMAEYNKFTTPYIQPTLRPGYDYSLNPIFRLGISPDQRSKIPSIGDRTPFYPQIISVGVPGQENFQKGGGIPERYKNMGFTKVGIKKDSNRPGKKWMVLAKKGDQYKVVHGGYKGMKDYTQHGSEERRKRFWDRMGGKNSAQAKNPFSPLYWHKRFGTW